MQYKDIEDMKQKADEGEMEAIVQLGMSYLYGYGVEIDYLQAFIRLQDAAIRNDGQAQLHLGYMYEHGLGIKKDLWTALSLYRRSYKMRTPGSRKALGDTFNVVVDEIPITGSLTIGKNFAITACCEKFKEYLRMGRIIPFEDDNEENFYISNTNRNCKILECPFCGCSIIHK